jgi:predicted AlkP superfamily pyrophosphatase or phosphodiesterase
MGKVILILSDALRYDAAVAGMGFLGHLVESKQASLYEVQGELPSLSRPMYETIHTGLTSSQHGIVASSVVRRSNKPNVFEMAHQAGLSTAAAAYFWFSELYNRVPYDPIDDREVDDETLPIQHGRFYTQDDYPDLELFHTAAMLVRKFDPDYLLVHPMGMDYLGELYGADTREYRNHTSFQDECLAPLIVEWMGKGYNILVTGDHGINADHLHGGTTPEMRRAPLYVIQPGQAGRGNTGRMVSMLQLAPTLCKLLGVEAAETMKAAEVD